MGNKFYKLKKNKVECKQNLIRDENNKNLESNLVSINGSDSMRLNKSLNSSYNNLFNHEFNLIKWN